MKNKKHVGDMFLWLEKVHVSCETKEQLISYRQLLRNFSKMYKDELRRHRPYAVKYSILQNNSYKLNVIEQYCPITFETAVVSVSENK